LYRHAERVGLLADRKEIQYRRYYVLDPDTHTEPVTPTPVAQAEAAQPDADAGPGRLELTPKAVEMARKALVKRGTPEAALRVGVRGGGCSGASYVIEFADKIRARRKARLTANERELAMHEAQDRLNDILDKVDTKREKIGFSQIDRPTP
jgi:Fe-S cluster assembly iron-binding protein IscA